MVLCDLSANGKNGFVWMLVADWWIQLAHRLHLGVKLLINDIYYYNDQNKKLHFADTLRHYVHACREVAMYELHKKSVRRCFDGTYSHPIKYYNLRL